MKRKFLNYSIVCIILATTIIGVALIYKSAKKIEYPWYFDSLKIIENQSKNKDKTIGIAVIDSGFKSNMEKYFNNEVICYNATDDESTEDLTGHGTQIALLIGSNSRKKINLWS